MSGLVDEAADEPSEPTASLEIERAERLVEQQQLWPSGERASERDPLSLTAGQLVGAAAGERGSSRALEPVPGGGPPVVAGPTVGGRVPRWPRRCGEAAGRAAGTPCRSGARGWATSSARRVDEGALVARDAALRRLVEARDQPEEPGLACSGGTEEHGQARRQLEPGVEVEVPDAGADVDVQAHSAVRSSRRTSSRTTIATVDSTAASTPAVA
jgi:hypothetical protein